MVKIRLRRMGAKKKPFYRIVVADSRTSRDGRFIEIIGYYDPTVEPPVLKLEKERAEYWLSNGAQPSDTTRALLKIQGLMGGVTKKSTEPKKKAAKAEQPEAEEVEAVEAAPEAAPVEVVAEEAPAEEEKPKSRARKPKVAEEAPAEEEKPKTRAKKTKAAEEATEEPAAKAEEAAPADEPATEAESEEPAAEEKAE